MNDVSLKDPKWRRLLAALLLVGVVAAAYYNSLRGEFVWDDINSIELNPAIQHLTTVFDRPPSANTASGRPLLILTLALNYALGGLNPVGYHVVNVVIHSATALALFGFLRRLLKLPKWNGRFAANADVLALATAGVWALHPLQTEAVAYVIQRAESLMGLCYFLTLWLFLRSADSPRPTLWRALAIGACALGMTAKEVMVSAPVLVLLTDRTFLSGSFRQAVSSKRGFYGGVFATWIIAFALVLSLGGDRGGSTGGLSTHAPWFGYWLTQFPAIATYLKLAFVPYPLIFQYGPFWMPSALAALPTALLVVPLIALTIVALVRWPTYGYFGVWFFAILSVTSLVPGTSDMIVEHRMYVALAPLWILVAIALHRWNPRFAPYALGTVALIFAVLTVDRNTVYSTGARLWSDNVTKRPDNPLTHYNLSVELQKTPGHTAEIRAHLEAAVRLRPDFAMAHYNLALLLAQQPDQTDAAVFHFREAIRSAPKLPEPRINLAVLLVQRGQTEEAAQQLAAALKCPPPNQESWLILVDLLAKVTGPDEAILVCQNLVQAHPTFAPAQTELGILLAGQQRLSEAVVPLETAVRLDPAQPLAHRFLGNVLVYQNLRLPEAISHLETAARLQPNSADIHFDLGTALFSAARVSEAISHFKTAVQLEPQFADAHFNLATALESLGGDLTEAISHYRAAASLQPEIAAMHYRLARVLAPDPHTRAEARRETEKALSLDPQLTEARDLLRSLD